MNYLYKITIDHVCMVYNDTSIDRKQLLKGTKTLG